MSRIKWTLFGIPSSGKIAVFGIAYDSSSELRKGTLYFPIAVRIASYGVEWEEGISVHETGAADLGDFLPSVSPEKMVEEVFEFMEDVWNHGYRKFLVLGGNHSITIPVVKFLAEKGVRRYLQFDAHADARDSWSGTKYSFACTFRRVAEILGIENVSLVGVRSVAAEERDFLEGVNVIYAREFEERKDEVLKLVKKADYISIDMDVFSGVTVTNPEPAYALKPGEIFDVLKGKKIAFDIVEGVPTAFADSTSALGALLARRALLLLKD